VARWHPTHVISIFANCWCALRTYPPLTSASPPYPAKTHFRQQPMMSGTSIFPRLPSQQVPSHLLRCCSFCRWPSVHRPSFLPSFHREIAPPMQPIALAPSPSPTPRSTRTVYPVHACLPPLPHSPYRALTDTRSYPPPAISATLCMACRRHRQPRVLRSWL
jgi:hypothetical protein